MKACLDEDVEELHRVLEADLLHPVFQPIVDFRARACLGHEALIRGPENSCLQMPTALFETARRCGLGLALEHAARDASLRAFSRLRLPGRLFLNASPGSLLSDEWMNGPMRSLLGELGIAANRIVIEITENEQIIDMPEMQGVLKHYRGRGFQIAIDDLGEGFANLRMWSEVRPEFVKIDRHFIDGIAGDRMKYHFVRAMQDIAESCNSVLIAEGIERIEDFECVRDMGISCGQGYFISRPQANPSPQLPEDIAAALGRSRTALMPSSMPTAKAPTAKELLRPVAPVPCDATNEYVFARFEADAELDALPVVDGLLPVGLINRHSMVDRFARPFRKELFGRKSCQQFMDPSPLIVDQHATVQELAMMLALAPKHYLFDGFIVTGEGAYLGIGSSHDLMAMITEMQLCAARYANPLTQLPGNVPINEHIDSMLASGHSFVAAYLDIDNFKPYNDTFGYRRGDDVILLLAQLTSEVVDKRIDFVGHIGGDDFFVIFQSQDWEERCWDIVACFTKAVAATVDAGNDAGAGYLAENRKGELVRQLMPTLSVGAVRVEPGQYESHREVAAAASMAKKQAKKENKRKAGEALGGGVFVERRQPGAFRQAAGLPHQLN